MARFCWPRPSAVRVLARGYGMRQMGEGGEVKVAREYIARALFLKKSMGVLGLTSVQLAKAQGIAWLVRPGDSSGRN